MKCPNCNTEIEVNGNCNLPVCPICHYLLPVDCNGNIACNDNFDIATNSCDNNVPIQKAEITSPAATVATVAATDSVTNFLASPEKKKGFFKKHKVSLIIVGIALIIVVLACSITIPTVFNATQNTAYKETFDNLTTASEKIETIASSLRTAWAFGIHNLETTNASDVVSSLSTLATGISGRSIITAYNDCYGTNFSTSTEVGQAIKGKGWSSCSNVIEQAYRNIAFYYEAEGFLTGAKLKIATIKNKENQEKLIAYYTQILLYFELVDKSSQYSYEEFSSARAGYKKSITSAKLVAEFSKV